MSHTIPVARGNVLPPALSRDGSTLVWNGYTDGQSDLYLHQADSIERITFDEALDTDPALSADGGTVVWSRRGPEGMDLMVRRPGGQPEVLLVAEGDQRQPAVSADAIVVAFKDDDHISLLKDGEALAISSPGPTESDSRPWVTADGSKIFWERMDSRDFTQTLWMRDATGADRPVLKEFVSAAVSDDGNTIAFSKWVGQDKDVFKLDLRTGETSVVSAKKGVNESFPSVSADGSAVAYNVVDFSNDEVEAYIHLNEDGQDRQLVGRRQGARDLFPRVSADGSVLSWTLIDNQNLLDRQIFRRRL